MSAYRFPLQRLLDLRGSAEDRARCRLAASQIERARQQAALSACQGAWERAVDQRQARLSQAQDGARLLSDSLHLACLSRRACSQQARVEQCVRQEAEHRQQLLQTARERQVIARLKDRRREQYLKAQAAAQQRLLDEAGLLGYYRR